MLAPHSSQPDLRRELENRRRRQRNRHDAESTLPGKCQRLAGRIDAERDIHKKIQLCLYGRTDVCRLERLAEIYLELSGENYQNLRGTVPADSIHTITATMRAPCAQWLRLEFLKTVRERDLNSIKALMKSLKRGRADTPQKKGYMADYTRGVLLATKDILGPDLCPVPIEELARRLHHTTGLRGLRELAKRTGFPIAKANAPDTESNLQAAKLRAERGLLELVKRCDAMREQFRSNAAESREIRERFMPCDFGRPSVSRLVALADLYRNVPSAVPAESAQTLMGPITRLLSMEFLKTLREHDLNSLKALEKSLKRGRAVKADLWCGILSLIKHVLGSELAPTPLKVIAKSIHDPGPLRSLRRHVKRAGFLCEDVRGQGGGQPRKLRTENAQKEA